MQHPDISLEEIYQLLYLRYGPQHWWPVIQEGEVLYLTDPQPLPRRADHQWQIVLGAILTQNTAWKNVEQALINLWDDCRADAVCLAGYPDDRLAVLIRPTGYFRQKARKLHIWLDRFPQGHLNELAGISTAAARQELLALWGIGPETADSILLYALGQTVFVIDAYTRRIAERLGIPEARASYDILREYFETRLRPDPRSWGEFHALLVNLAKDTCQKRQPRCEACCLLSICKFSTSSQKKA